MIFRKYFEVHGRPSNILFLKDDVQARRNNYWLLWGVRSFTPILEYRLLYRQTAVVSSRIELPHETGIFSSETILVFSYILKSSIPMRFTPVAADWYFNSVHLFLHWIQILLIFQNSSSDTKRKSSDWTNVIIPGSENIKGSKKVSWIVC